jgi:geranylgeranyl pyrophosphate synthase
MKISKALTNNAKNVNEYIDIKLKGDPKMLYEAAKHLITHGEKRLELFMVIKSCQILGAKGQKQCLLIVQ